MRLVLDVFDGTVVRVAVFIVVSVVKIFVIHIVAVVDVVAGVFVVGVPILVVVVVVDVVELYKYPFSTVKYFVPSASWQFIDSMRSQHVGSRHCGQSVCDLSADACQRDCL